MRLLNSDRVEPILMVWQCLMHCVLVVSIRLYMLGFEKDMLKDSLGDQKTFYKMFDSLIVATCFDKLY